MLSFFYRVHKRALFQELFYRALITSFWLRLFIVRGQLTSRRSRALLINETALIGWLWLIDRDCLRPDFGGNIVGDQ